MRAHQRRGMTFIEVLLASAILASIAITIIASITLAQKRSVLDQERINAAELAHRYLLTYIHVGPNALPPQSEPKPQGAGWYTYSLSEQILEEEVDESEDVSIRTPKPYGVVSANDRLSSGIVYLTVSVFPAPNQEGLQLNPEVPLATISRIYDPFDVNDPDTLMDIVQKLLEGGLQK
ncbi:MAG: hypothetical protein H6813_04705 [Phycisphaeraceae bacterium]|nr:hypothetical protein [Phycisphaeraceae bacterium]MCB9847250.1 hypothetical protein [Phycisphaeraceae bacterium]